MYTSFPLFLSPVLPHQRSVTSIVDDNCMVRSSEQLTLSNFAFWLVAKFCFSEYSGAAKGLRAGSISYWWYIHVLLRDKVYIFTFLSWCKPQVFRLILYIKYFIFVWFSTLLFRKSCFMLVSCYNCWQFPQTVCSLEGSWEVYHYVFTWTLGGSWAVGLL